MNINSPIAIRTFAYFIFTKRAAIATHFITIIGVAVLVYHITKPEKMKPPTQPVAVDNSQK